ncbi:hypothetical protein BDQ17DRAFT_1433303 [Cyathus striatus]|nr:hypothetical protein BDQ17DRAFT_1433303 [Cyathus striatus]
MINSDLKEFQTQWNHHPISGAGHDQTPHDICFIGELEHGRYKEHTLPVHPEILQKYSQPIGNTDHGLDDLIMEDQQHNIRHEPNETPAEEQPFNSDIQNIFFAALQDAIEARLFQRILDCVNHQERSGGSGKTSISHVKRKVKDTKIKKQPPRVGSVLFITCGINKRGLPLDEKVPLGSKLEKLRKAGLFITKHNGNMIEYSEEWGPSEIDAWLHTLFPPAFALLDEKYGVLALGKYHWVLLRKCYTTLFQLARDEITGEALMEAHGSSSRKLEGSSALGCSYQASLDSDTVESTNEAEDDVRLEKSNSDLDINHIPQHLKGHEHILIDSDSDAEPEP